MHFLQFIKRAEEMEEQRMKIGQEMLQQQVSYIFCDCKIKFTSPYRFACFNRNGT